MIITSKIGFGGKISGTCVVVGGKGKELGSRDLTLDLEGKVLVCLVSPSREFLEKAKFVGVSGVVVPEMHVRDFEYFKSQGDLVIMVLQKFGGEGVQGESQEKISKLDGKMVELDGEAHEFKVS